LLVLSKIQLKLSNLLFGNLSFYRLSPPPSSFGVDLARLSRVALFFDAKIAITKTLIDKCRAFAIKCAAFRDLA
jgi:hypothetical protein